jgi:hypothetical protein
MEGLELVTITDFIIALWARSGCGHPGHFGNAPSRFGDADVYAVLHHPEYRERSAANLRRRTAMHSIRRSDHRG